MRTPLLLGLVLLLAAAAPTPPEPPPEKQAETAPTPPEKPSDQEAERAGDPAEAEVPVPPDRAERPAPADVLPGLHEEPANVVPIPRDVPDEIEKARQPEDRGETKPKRLITDTTEPVAEAACRVRLRDLPVKWTQAEEIEKDRCGIGAPVTVTEAAGLKFVPAATVNCRTAEAVTLWLRDEVVPAARTSLEDRPVSLFVASSYVCRNRYGQTDGKISEHAFGNAIDISGFGFDDGRFDVMPGSERDEKAQSTFQEKIRKAACDRFTTVLGPGTNAAHKTHFHFDLRQRRGGYRLCE